MRIEKQIRLSPEAHKSLMAYKLKTGISIKKVVEFAVKDYLRTEDKRNLARVSKR